MTDTVAIVKRLRERANFYLESKGNPPHYYSFDAAVDLEAADEIERLREALEQIRRWADAYPLDIFPEPDFRKARELLEAGGITLDAISASNMRHVVKAVSGIADRALKGKADV